MTNCNDIDFMALLDGVADEEAVAHIDRCEDCREEFERIQRLVGHLDVFFSVPANESGAVDHEALLREFEKEELAVEDRPLPLDLSKAVEEFKTKQLQARTTAAIARVLDKEQGDGEVTQLRDKALGDSHDYAAAAAPKDLLKPGGEEDEAGDDSDSTDKE